MGKQMAIEESRQFGRARVFTLVAVMFCCLFYCTGRQNFGFAIPGMAEEFGLTKTQLGWCGMAMLWAYACGQAINGQLADRIGGRKLMTFGGLLSFLMNIITSFAGLGKPLNGQLIETRNSTHMVFPVVAVACALGAILMSVIRKTA